MADEDEDGVSIVIRELLALLAFGDGVHVRFHSLRRGPPVHGRLRILNEDTLVVERIGTGFGCGRTRTLAATPLSAVRSVVAGRRSSCFLRTAKYVEVDVSAESASPLSARCLSLELGAGSASGLASGPGFDRGSGSSSFDMEVLDRDGGRARRDRLLRGFAAHCDVPVLDSLPHELRGPPRGVTQQVHALMSSAGMTAFVSACIVASVSILAVTPPKAPGSASAPSPAAFAWLETAFSVVFTLEVVGRIVGLESAAFFASDAWNALDVFVVGSGWVTALAAAASGGDSALNFTAFRALRALRALRAFKMFGGIRDIVDTFVRTLGTVCQGMLLYAYLLVLATIVAFEAWGGTLSSACATADEAVRPLQPTVYCSAGQDDACPSGFACASTEAWPTTATTGFHSFASTLRTLYGVSLRAGLGTPVRGVIAASGAGGLQHAAVVLFFVFFNLFVSNMVLSIFVAIIRNTFAGTRSQAAARRRRISEQSEAEALEQSVRESDMSFSSFSSFSGEVAVNFKHGVKRKVAAKSTSAATASAKVIPERQLQHEHQQHQQQQQGQEEEKEKTKEKEKEKEREKEKEKEKEGPLASKRPDRARLQRWVESNAFDTSVSAVILLNCCFFALAYFGQPQGRTDMLRRAEAAFAFVFLAEALTKVLALGGPRRYLRSAWNRFDAVVVVCSLVDVFASDFVNLSLLRVLRLLRVVRLLRRNPDIVHIVSALVASVPQLANLMLFSVLLTAVFAILGMQLYGARLVSPATGVSPRANFDSFPEAMLALFQMLTGGAQWPVYDSVMASDMAATGPIFFLAFGVFSGFIILNFMVVVIMSKLGLSPDEVKKMRTERDREMLQALKRGQSQRSSLALLAATKTSDPDAEPQPLALELGWNFAWVDALVPRSRQRLAFGLWGPQHPVRRVAKRVASHALFEGLVLAAIVASSVLLTLEAPKQAQAYEARGLEPPNAALLAAADAGFVVVFAAEAVVKVAALGLLLPRHAYLKNAWNRLDAVLLLVSFLGMSVGEGGGGALGRMLRVGRILRPLRMINRNEGLKVIVDALFRAVKPVSYTVVLLVVYFFCWGVIGMEFFSGRFWRCNDAAVALREDCVGHFVGPLALLRPRVWANPGFSFDSIGEALGTLFETISLKGWPEKLHAAMDVAGVDVQPVRDASPAAALFLVIFIYFGSFFAMKLFVGVIVGTFRSFSGTLLLTPHQLQWIEMKKVMARLKLHARPPSSRPQRACRGVAQSAAFESAAVVATLAHVACVAALQTGLLPASCGVPAHVLFTTAHVGFHGVRLVATGPRSTYCALGYSPSTLATFWRPRWAMLFELLWLLGLVLFPLLGLPLAGAAVLRALDFTSLVALAKKRSPVLCKMIAVLAECALAMLNVTLVFFMALFIYAVLGMQLFGTVKSGRVLGATASFETFPEALFTVFGVASGDNWVLVMRDCAQQAPACSPGVDCGSVAAARTYFYSLYFLCFGVVLNLFVATIVDAYESKTKVDGFRWAITQDQLAHFQRTWKRHDEHATGRVSVRLVREVVFDLGWWAAAPDASAGAPSPPQSPSQPPSQSHGGEGPGGPELQGDDDVAVTTKRKRMLMNRARFEIFPLLSTASACALPGGRVATKADAEPSVGFFQVLQVAVMLDVDDDMLSPAERVERARKEVLIRRNLAAMAIQAAFRGALYHRIFRALISTARRVNLRTVRPADAQKMIAQTYLDMYGGSIVGLALGFLASGDERRDDEISFANVPTPDEFEVLHICRTLTSITQQEAQDMEHHLRRFGNSASASESQHARTPRRNSHSVAAVASVAHKGAAVVPLRNIAALQRKTY